MLDLKNKTIFDLFNNNISFDLIIGTIHIIIAILIIITPLICSNIYYLFIMVILSFLNIVSILYVKTCPLFVLEYKYLNTTFIKLFFNSFQVKSITKNRYLTKYLKFKQLDEVSLEFFIIISSIITIKILYYILINSL